jgi:ArsR family transcriptional regulator, zinc-responsive transcriptional repressor
MLHLTSPLSWLAATLLGMTKSDPMLQQIAAQFARHDVQRSGRGYVIVNRRTSDPVARLRPIPGTDRYELFYWSNVKGCWTTFGFPAPPPREILEAAGELLRALAAPVRIAIVLQLRESQRCVHELVDALGVPQPLVSQHLKILKAAGVVTGERSGREVLYRLADHHLAHIVIDAVAHASEDKP